MPITQETIAEIKRAVDIVDVINAYVPLKRAGSEYRALSPFNKEKTPSFFVNPSKQMFHCFSSGQGGDVFKFVMLYENLDFPSAVRRVAERAGIAVEEEGTRPGEWQQKKKKRDALLAVHAAVAAHWQELLRMKPEGGPGREYLASRKIPLEWVREFGLGYAPPAWDDTLRWGRAKGYGQDLLLEAGLLARNDENRVYDRFRGRLVFPVHDDQGQVVAFSARLLEQEARAAKYINSPETVLFHKGRILFGFHRAKRPILDAGSVVVCEGQIDVLRCHAAGILQVVAPLGTSFTPEHLALIKRLTSNITLCLDADRAGKKAAGRVADMVMGDVSQIEAMVRADFSLRVASLPEGQDPDSYLLAHGADAFRQILAGAEEYTDFYLRQLGAEMDLGSIEGKLQAVRELAVHLARVPNRAHREELMLRVQRRLDLSPKALEEEVDRQIRASSRPREPTAGPAAAPIPARTVDSLIEQMLILMLADNRLVPEFQKHLRTEWLTDLRGGDLVLKMLDMHAAEMWSDVESLYPHLVPADQLLLARLAGQALASGTVGVGGEVERAEQTFARTCRVTADLCRGLNRRWLEDSQKQVAVQLREPGLAPEAQERLTRRMADLNRQWRELTKTL